METTVSQIAEFTKTAVTEILERLGFSVELTVTENDGVVTAQIATNHDELLTGRSSEPLLALQHLLRIMLRTAYPDTTTTISLNVGDYHERQQERLTELAKSAAAQARATKLAVHMPAMSSYERRIIHLVVGEEPGVVSESEGMGASRRITIRPSDGQNA